MNTRKQLVINQIKTYLEEARQNLAKANDQEEVDYAVEMIQHWNEQIHRAYVDLPIIYK